MACEYPIFSRSILLTFNMSSRPNLVPRKKVAIIGSGCAGIGALWALNRTHHDVYIYEAADRLGGHTNTAEFRNGKSKTMVDTGFIVLNSATYRKYPTSMHPPPFGTLTRYSELSLFPQGHRGRDYTDRYDLWSFSRPGVV